MVTSKGRLISHTFEAKQPFAFQTQKLSLYVSVFLFQMFFDDSIRNIGSAKATGIKTVFVGDSVLVPGADYALSSIHNKLYQTYGKTTKIISSSHLFSKPTMVQA
ncbi:hypothetical protein F2Q70_00026367 [Brassica cretica]|uniref:Uncharacterized protein n=3 Tax=Brassica cretica TaxID=69181 RepID=A0A8S9LI22_BRACR|nr:hypothetical protein F2Q68_00025926 [Brassica cretica]KAF2605068.1 hypothetical protein F2Q70_00026367 [Brassica cretica]KAF3582846.1 hypothetical protein DY000_02031933 [Brassica cretica]